MKRYVLFICSLLATSIPMTTTAQTLNEVFYTPGATTFCLAAPINAKEVRLRIYDEGTGGTPMSTIAMRPDKSSERWTAEVPTDLNGKFYTFDIDMGKGFQGETPGLFAKAVGVNGKRGAIIDMSKTNPTGWENDMRPTLKSPADQVIYELHHRDFSIDASSGLVNKGKFLALTEAKAIDHLKRLGVNTIHLLPSFDYASVDETRLNEPQYNWGYDPVNYNVPEGSYSTDPFNPTVRIKEFKRMVQVLHKAGIRVVLDVVYNHTFDIEGSNFQRVRPDYFFRKTADGHYSNGSGCGNETASEQSLMRQFMIESVEYWIQEYHIDGFRFDLMGIHDIATMNAIRKAASDIDPTIFIYGEGWSAGSCAYPQEQLAMKAHMQKVPGIAAFCDDMRDALRGPFNDDHRGAFLAGLPGHEESIKFGIAGAISHPQIDITKVNYSEEAWAAQPTQMIGYVSCHDDMCLVDRLKTSIPGITTEELIRLDLLAQTAVFTSQGVPFILCGEEMLRDKKGVHNSYNSPDSINHLNWNNLETYPQVFQYYSGLAELRRNHPAFRLGDSGLVKQHLEFLKAPRQVVAFRLKNHAGGDSWRDIIVILNANRAARKVSIPSGSWTVVCKDGIIDLKGIAHLPKTSKVTVGPQEALIIHN
ncbi:MAG: type I pullulanase [Prevotella sp.]